MNIFKESNKLNSIQQSFARKFFNVSKKKDSIDLTIGDPDILPPKEIREAACKCINDGKTRYSNNAGLYCVRQAIAKFNSKKYNIDISSQNIMLTVGGMQALYLTFFSLLNKDDQVIINGPYYPNYVNMVNICGGKSIINNTYEENNYKIDVNKLQKLISNKTKILVLNSPNNPTGHVITEYNLIKIANFSKKYNLIVISDQVYQTLIYDNIKYKSIFTLLDMDQRTIVIDSMSKKFSMTGYRFGYLICMNTELIQKMSILQQNMVSCVSLPSQYAALEAYSNNINYQYIYDQFLKRRNLVIKKIKQIKKLKLYGIPSTFYAFINIKDCNMNSIQFCNKLLEEYNVSVVPGITYGKEYDNYIRISFTVNCKQLQKAFNKIKQFVENL